mgnify:CR=1 FL=1
MPQDVKGAAGFRDWIAGFRSRALSKGISTATFDAAFRGVSYDPKVVNRDRNQNEFTKTVWVYLDSAASDARIAAGKKALAEHRALLDAALARDHAAALALLQGHLRGGVEHALASDSIGRHARG